MFQSVNTTLWKILISSVSSCLTWNIVPIISHCRLKVQHMHRNVHTHTYTDNVCMHTLARFYVPYKYVPYGGHTHTHTQSSAHTHTHKHACTHTHTFIWINSALHQKTIAYVRKSWNINAMSAQMASADPEKVQERSAPETNNMTNSHL